MCGRLGRKYNDVMTRSHRRSKFWRAEGRMEAMLALTTERRRPDAFRKRMRSRRGRYEAISRQSSTGRVWSDMVGVTLLSERDFRRLVGSVCDWPRSWALFIDEESTNSGSRDETKNASGTGTRVWVACFFWEPCRDHRTGKGMGLRGAVQEKCRYRRRLSRLQKVRLRGRSCSIMPVGTTRQ